VPVILKNKLNVDIEKISEYYKFIKKARERWKLPQKECPTKPAETIEMDLD
jgi:hypothetical protein